MLCRRFHHLEPRSIAVSIWSKAHRRIVSRRNPAERRYEAKKALNMNFASFFNKFLSKQSKLGCVAHGYCFVCEINAFSTLFRPAIGNLALEQRSQIFGLAIQCPSNRVYLVCHIAQIAKTAKCSMHIAQWLSTNMRVPAW